MQTTSQPSIVTPLSVTTSSKVNWPHVTLFLSLALGLSWLTDLVLYLNGGLASPVTLVLMQFRMLTPAFSGLLLASFFFKESPIYYRSNRTASRWFVYFYLLLTFFYLIGSIAGLIQPTQIPIISAFLLIPNLIGLILLIVLRWKGGKEAFASTRLAGGNWRVWLVYELGVVAFYGLQTFLNYVFKLGKVVDVNAAFPQLVAANLPGSAIILIMAFQMVIIGPLLGLIISFGEEHGWRDYLQTELIRLGRIRGVFPLGVRLFLAGLCQSTNPKFTAQPILGINSDEPLQIVQELGFANLSIGTMGILTIFNSNWITPAAIVGSLFYGLAGMRHVIKRERNFFERPRWFQV